MRLNPVDASDDVSVNVAVATWLGVPASVAVTVKVYVPVDDVVPEINPVVALRTNPGGSDPDVTE